MAELAALRAKLKDRQVKEGALGTAEASICLDLGLLDELHDIERRRALASVTGGDPDSLAGAATPDTSDLDAEIAAKQDEVRAATLTLVFRALSSVNYQAVVNRFEDPDEAQRADFLSALAEACFREAWNEGEKVALSWPEVAPEISEGEFEDIAGKVFNLNKRRQDIPFSLTPSRPTRR